MCVCLHFVPILASKYQHCASDISVSPVVGLCFYCTFSPWLLMYVQSVKMAEYPGGPAIAPWPQRHTPSLPHAHAADTLVSVAAKQLNIPCKMMMLAPGNDVFDLFISQAQKFSL